MLTQLAAFFGVAALVIVTPGPDTALTVRNALLGGRRAGTATAAGVVTGQAAWALLSAAGLAALLRASQPAFLAVRIAGAAYLALLGLQALAAAARGPAGGAARPGPRVGARRAYRQGLLSNLGNPKMVVFFLSLLPQFATSGIPPLALGLAFCGMTLLWLAGYARAAARAGDVLRRPRVRRALETVTGIALVGLGLRLAAARRA